MASRLYELLGVPNDATVEQIRKAYRKKALKTHPDKLPPDLSEEEREAGAEKFREISHACEILTDPGKRREYDIHGVWPPPPPEEDAFKTPFGNGWHSRSHVYTPHDHHHSYRNYVFRDPFELFRTMFEDFDDIFQAPMRPHFAPFDPFSHFSSHFSSHRSQSLFPESIFAMPTIGFNPSPWSSDISGGRGSSYSESYSSQTINGVTETIHTVHDQDGNKHVTRQYPDGREVYSINGVEQPSSRGDHRVQDATEPRLLTPGPSRPRRGEPPLYSRSQPPQLRRDTRHSNGRDPSYSRNYSAQTALPSSRRREYDEASDLYTGGHYPYGSYDHYEVPRRSRSGHTAYTGHAGPSRAYDNHHYMQPRSSPRG